MNHKRRWQLYAPLGLALIGFGVSIISYAVERRTLGAGLSDWFF